MCAAISLIMCVPFFSCEKNKDKEESKKTVHYDSDNASQIELNQYLDDAVAANSGDAYLALADTAWKAQYWGSSEDTINASLCYEAGVAAINGNGDYTVSVSADTEGFRYAVTGNPETSYTPEGIEVLSVMIKDGETKFPNAAITVNEIRVDGKAVELTSKAYTSSDDGIDTKANIVNRWISSPSSDARCADGALYDENGKALELCEDYSPVIVSDEVFSKWSKIEVDFTVSGIDTNP